jgi:hypothetical protein
MSEQQMIIDLVNRSIDGTAHRQEQERLQKLMAGDPAIRQLYDDMKKVTTLLDGAGEQDPPPHLRKKIMNVIDGLPAPSEQTESLLTRLKLSILPRPGYSFAFGAGLIVGILAILLFYQVKMRENSIDLSNLYGSVMDREIPMGQVLPLNLKEISGRIGVRNAENGILAEFDLNASREVTIRLSYNRNELEFDGYRMIEGTILSVTTEENHAAITLQGISKNLMLFRKKSDQVSPLTVTIFTGGSKMFEEMLPLGNKTP